jgi:hypothetical protein
LRVQLAEDALAAQKDTASPVKNAAASRRKARVKKPAAGR